MKKRVLSMALAATMTAALFAGCSSNANNNGTTATTGGNGETAAQTEAPYSGSKQDVIDNLIAGTTDTVKLTVWCSELETYQTGMASLVEKFKAEYPTVTFDITIGAESESNCKDDVLKDPEAAADVFVFADDQVNELVSAGVLDEIDPITYDALTANTASSVAAASVGDKVYAYPLTGSNGYFLYYNKEYLSEEDVASWESLAAACEKAGKDVSFEFSGAWYLYGFYAGAGLNCTLSEDGTYNVCDWDCDLGRAVSESIKSICASANVKNLTGDDTVPLVKDGSVIAFVNGTWNYETMKEAWGDNLGATKLPTFKVNGTDTQMGSFSGSKLVGVNSYSANAGWATLLAEYITCEASQVALCNATGEGPTNLAAASQVTLNVAVAALNAQAPYATPQRVAGNYWSPTSTLGKALAEGTYTDDDLTTAVAGIVAK